VGKLQVGTQSGFFSRKKTQKSQNLTFVIYWGIKNNSFSVAIS